MNASGRRGCKGCRAAGQVTAEHVAELLSAPALQVPGVCVPEGVYQARLEQCRPCPQLQADGYTCALCGCIVQVMAKHRQRVCPQPGEPRWGRYAG